jgi:hypothetical protein
MNPMIGFEWSPSILIAIVIITFFKRLLALKTKIS